MTTELTPETLAKLDRMMERSKFDAFILDRAQLFALIASARALAESRAECERLREALEGCDRHCNDGHLVSHIATRALHDAVRGRVGKP